jgi:hypothetical protein
MFLWVDNILAPYVDTAPEGIVPILFLDAFSVHQMQSVVSRIQALGVEVVPIPGGCKCVIQPVDIGFNDARNKEQLNARLGNKLLCGF